MIHNSMIVHYDKKSSSSEAFRMLRTNILFSKGSRFPKVIMLTSTGPSEGKSTTSSNLALAFAQSGHKTIIIDADLRRPTVHQLFGLSRLHGFSTLLSKRSTYEETIQRVEEGNIDVITSGPTSQDPTELLSTKALEETIEYLKQNYDIIIVDTPPVGILTDAAILASISTEVVLVLKEGSVSGRQFEHVKEQLERVGANIIGVVFNMVGGSLNTKGKYYYSYYNYYYYRYGYYYSNYSNYEDRDPTNKRKTKDNNKNGFISNIIKKLKKPSSNKK